MSDQLANALHGVTLAQIRRTVSKWCRSTPRVPPEDEADIAQEVLKAVWTKASTSPGHMRNQSDVIGYASRVARNCRADYFTKRKRSRTTGEGVEHVPSRPDELARDPRHGGTCEHLASLLPDHVALLREVFLALCLEQGTQVEVAHLLKTSLSTVRRRWAEAEEFLTRLFRTPEEGTS